MNTFIYTPANRVPGIARKLKRQLNANIVRQDLYPKSPWLVGGDIVINYGGGTEPVWANFCQYNPVEIINHWKAVRNSADKISTFQMLDMLDVPTLRWTTEKETAQTYERTVVRALVKSTGAKGLTVINNEDGMLPTAPLYTEYYQKKYEFRVHVFDGKVIDFTQKKMLSEEKRKERGIEPMPYIRSYGNGWIFSRNNIQYFPQVDALAIRACKALGLDFAGVDILCNVNKDGTFKDAVVCETNAAPGMQGTTFKKYKAAFQNRIGAF